MSTVCETERSPVRAALARGVAGPAQGPAARHGRLQVRSLGLALEASSHTPTIWTQPRTPIPPLPPALRALRSLAPLPVKDETAQSTGGGGGASKPRSPRTRRGDPAVGRSFRPGPGWAPPELGCPRGQPNPETASGRALGPPRLRGRRARRPSPPRGGRGVRVAPRAQGTSAAARRTLPAQSSSRRARRWPGGPYL